MVRTIEYLATIGIFLFHCIIVAIILFGWAVPQIWFFYTALLAITLVSDILLGYCFLSRWEFALRKALKPRIKYDYTFSSYYTYKVTHKRLSTHFIRNAGLLFLTASLLINLYFAYGNKFGL